MGDKTFAHREAAFKRALIKGTPEWTRRQEYPGPIAETECHADENCVRFAGGPKITSYWLCPACEAPDVTVDYKTHAPPLKAWGLDKRTQANRAAFLAWCLVRNYDAKKKNPEADGGPATNSHTPNESSGNASAQ